MPDAGTGLLIVTVAAPTNAMVTGRPSSWSTAGIERQVNIHGGGQHLGSLYRAVDVSLFGVGGGTTVRAGAVAI